MRRILSARPISRKEGKKMKIIYVLVTFLAVVLDALAAGAGNPGPAEIGYKVGTIVGTIFGFYALYKALTRKK